MNKQGNFINKSINIHGDRYDYSLVDYKNARTNITIVCPIHGEFDQLPKIHTMGSGCKKCYNEKRTKPKNNLIVDFTNIHGDRYDYSKVRYVNSKTKVIITCKEHGDFEQLAYDHLKGQGCKLCSKTKIHTNSSFILKSIKIHEDKYDYSLVDYKNNSTNVTIICPEHGEFEQKPHNHFNGKGCSKCGFNSISDTTSTFIVKSINMHGDRYDYSKVRYINSKSNVSIICPIHGEFKQKPEIHVLGSGCKQCVINSQTKNLVDFIIEIKEIHGNKYDYSLIDYKNYNTKVKLLCVEHGEFMINPKHLLQGQGCLKCGLKNSKPEQELKDFILSLDVPFIDNDRSILGGKELDIYMPSKNIAIEFNGLYWHNELHLDKNYHLDKTNRCDKQGIQLIHVFEDEWLYKKDILKSILKNKLGLTENKIYGRKCEIREVPTKERNIFLDNNHLQGTVRASINVGLYHHDELVSVMTFNKPRLGIGGNYDGYELSRFCNKIDTSVMGAASKLLKYFIKTYEPKEIKSYATKTLSNGGLYEKLGFNLNHINKPNYWYIVKQKREHRFNFRKSKLREQGFDTKNLTEHQIMLNRKIYRIYDCGTMSYSLKIE